MEIMDFIFYKIYTYYKKKDDIPVATGILFVFLVQLFFLLFIGIGINLLTENSISGKNIGTEKFYLIYGIVLGSLFVFDLIRYVKKSKVNSLVKKYEYSKLNTHIKTWMVFLIPVLIILFAGLMISIAE